MWVGDVVGLMQRAARKSALKMIERLQNCQDMQARRKGDRSWVLSLDLESHDIICEELGTFIPIVSEEDSASHDLHTEEGSFFFVDPLDGTSACKRFRREVGGQVGFGPLLGFVENGVIEAAVFTHVPKRLVFVARRGKGLYISPLVDSAEVKKIPPHLLGSKTLDDCVVLFHMGSELESQLIFRLKHEGVLDNAFRFGGFANDACRLALGHEELQIQMSVSPWDLPATLFAREVGFDVVIDPLGTPTMLEDWCLQSNNPVLVCPPQLTDSLIDSVRRIYGELTGRDLSR